MAGVTAVARDTATTQEIEHPVVKLFLCRRFFAIREQFDFVAFDFLAAQRQLPGTAFNLSQSGLSGLQLFLDNRVLFGLRIELLKFALNSLDLSCDLPFTLPVDSPHRGKLIGRDDLAGEVEAGQFENGFGIEISPDGVRPFRIAGS